MNLTGKKEEKAKFYMKERKIGQYRNQIFPERLNGNFLFNQKSSAKAEPF